MDRCHSCSFFFETEGQHHQRQIIHVGMAHGCHIMKFDELRNVENHATLEIEFVIMCCRMDVGC